MKSHYKINFIIILLIIATCAAFGRIGSNGFINLDDNAYITENHDIQRGINPESLKWALTAVVVSNWHPLTLLSHMLDWQLFGIKASGHHLISLFLHIGSVLFLFLFLNKTTNNIWPSAFAAVVFALHPLRVESVAWAAERKDVLSMFFGMACIYAYAFYAERSKFSLYFLSLILFALALMSKPMLVTLPFVLMLLDYWPLKRWQEAIDEPGRGFNSADRLIGEKVPFVLLAIISSIITLWAQNKGGALASVERLSFSERVINAIISYVAYLEKIFWPVNLAVFYPYELFPLWKVLISGFILIVITAVVLYYIKKQPFLFVGWFWYLGTLIPVIGLVQVGTQSMADRYTYLPSIGIAIMLVWFIPLLFKREDIRKRILIPVAIAVLAFLTVLTWQQCGYWKNSVELFNHALQVTKNNYLAHNNLGIALDEKGMTIEAIDHYSEALSIRPDYGPACFNRGNAYAALALKQQIVNDSSKTMREEPHYKIGYGERGDINDKLSLYRQTIKDLSKAISTRPNASAYNNRGIMYGKVNQYQRAIDDFSMAIILDHHYYKGHNNRGFAYAKLGQYQHAIEDYNKAISLKPDYVSAYKNRAFVYFVQGENKLYCIDAKKACELGDCRMLELSQEGACRR